MKKIEKAYQAVKSAKVGSDCKCPSCGSLFTKTSYQQAFCKTKSGTVCKDKYWNTVTPNKRNNTTRISPASAAFMAKNDTPVVLGYGDSQRKIDQEDRENLDLEYDGGWESHDANTGRCEFCNCIICRCD